jgi:hypothetical protein
MIPLHSRIEAFVTKDWRALKQLVDVPGTATDVNGVQSASLGVMI